MNKQPSPFEIADHMDFESAVLRGAMLMPDDVKRLFVFVKVGIEALLNVLAPPLDVVLHKHFGCRALGVFQLFITFCAGLLAFNIGAANRDWLVVSFGLGSASLAVWHFIEARLHQKERQSYDWGIPISHQGWTWLRHRTEPRLQWLVSEAAVVRFWEPGFCLLLGVLLVRFSLLGWFFMLSGVLLAWRSQLRYDRWRTIVLDQRDAKISGSLLNEANKPKSDVPQRYQAAILPLPALVAAVPPVQEQTAPEAWYHSSPELLAQDEPCPAAKVRRFLCRHCSRKVRVNNYRVGSKLACPHCHRKDQLVALPDHVANTP